LPLGALIGVGVGGFLLLLLLVGLFVRKHRKSKQGKRVTISDDGDLPAGWSMFIDEGTGYPCYVNPEGNTTWDPPVSAAAAGGIEMTHLENPMRTKIKTNRRHHARVSTQLPGDWTKHETEEGDRYYMDNEGITQWEAPEGATGGSTGNDTESMLSKEHTRSETKLPLGWDKDIDGEGNKYYYNEAGATSWTAPEGSTKDGQTHPDLHF
jgi:hypothetical protein